MLQAESQQEQATLRVVVFGTGSAGKTSLINALLGRKVGETEAVIGTTQHGENHTYELGGVEGTVYLTDTPGLAEAGPGGDVREIEARSLAVRADLLLFVVDHDLLRGEYERLIELARLGKRSIVVLNKKDRFPDRDLAAIAAKLRERLSGVIDAADIVTVAAAPRPIPVQVRRADGTTETVLEVEEPDIGALRARIGQVLAREGKLLRVANLLVRGRVLEREAHDQLEREREQRAEAVVEHYQWVAAGTVFANPIPALDILAGGAVQLDMIGELAQGARCRAFGRPGSRARGNDGAGHPQAGFDRSRHVADRGSIQAYADWFRGRRRRPGRDHGVLDEGFGPGLHRLLSPESRGDPTAPTPSYCVSSSSTTAPSSSRTS